MGLSEQRTGALLYPTGHRKATAAANFAPTSFDAAHRFCRAFDEVRNFLRPTRYLNQNVSLARRRTIHVQRVAALRDLISAA
jgi:hypothetical protein